MALTFVRVDGLEVHRVTDDVVLVADPVRAEHVASDARDVQRLATVVSLDQRDHLRSAAIGRHTQGWADTGDGHREGWA